MKKSLVLLVGILFMIGLSHAQDGNTGARVSTYSLDKTAEAYHSLGASAIVVVNANAKVDTLNNKFVLTKDSLVPVSVGVQKPLGPTFPNKKQYAACISLPQAMMFGTQEVRKVGMTTDGFLFFGDMVSPVFLAGSKNVTYYLVQTARATDFVFFSLAEMDDTGSYVKPTVMLAGESTKIGYETNGDTLWIGYENIVVPEADNKTQTVSWNYRIVASTGEISLQTRGFYETESPARLLAFGMVGKKFTEDYWVSDFVKPSGEASSGARFCPIGKDTLKTGERYVFTMPEACVEVANPEINWKVTATTNTINLTGTTWANNTNIRFVLSETSTLADANKPVDKQGWSDAADYGWERQKQYVVLRAENKDGKYTNLDHYPFRNLQADKEYWMFAHVFNPTCTNGPLYGTPVVQKIKTAIAAPDGDIVFGKADGDSLVLVLPQAETGMKYMVALSESSLVGFDRDPFQNILVNGEEYAVDDEVVGYRGAKGQIKCVNVDAGTYAFDNLKKGTEYFVSVWYSKEEEGSFRYSSAQVEIGARTLAPLPDTLSFEDNVLAFKPASWRYSSGSNYMVDGQTNDGTASIKAISENNVLRAAMDPDKGRYSSYAITPVFNRNGIEKVGAVLNLGFELDDGSSTRPCASLSEGDSVVVYWAVSQESEQWTRLCRLDHSVKLNANGFVELQTPAFSPEQNFCLKIASHMARKSSYNIFFLLENVIVDEAVFCKDPVEITAPKDDISNHSALLTWEDGNEENAESFIVKYRAKTSDVWMKEDTTEDIQYLLSNLEPGTTYTVSIQAFCGEENGFSRIRTIDFATAYGLPYTYGVSGSLLPAGSGQYRGLPGQDLAAIENPAAGDGWMMNVDAANNTSMVNVLDKNSNTWLMLPKMVMDNAGKLNLRVDVAAFGYNLDTDDPQEAKKTHDSLWLFASITGDFKNDRQLVGVLNLDSLHLRMQGDNMVYDVWNMEWEVKRGQDCHFAFYVAGKEAYNSSTYEQQQENVLAIDSIAIEYTEIFYPAVTALHLENLDTTSVTIVWKGEADTYHLLWKKQTDEKYDTVKGIDSTHYHLTGLKKATAYSYLVYGLYGGKAGQLSREMRFETPSGEAPTMDTVKTPEFSDTGVVAAGTVIRITCQTDKAQIYYTIDGSTPTSRSILYRDGVRIDTAVTIKAIAIKSGMTPSKVAVASYTLKPVGNENLDLSGIRIYPNPNNGRFSIEVPDQAMVEVFTTNGRMVERLEVTAGQSEMSLGHAGVYFVRVTVNGQVVVKKVVVR